MRSPDDGTPPFQIEVLDRDRKLKQYVTAPLAVSLAIRHNGAAYCSVELSNLAAAVPALLAEGARLRVTYAGEVHTGPVRQITTTGSRLRGRVIAEMDGDLRVALICMLGWPVPTAGLTAQTREYDVRSGPAETVAKGLTAANAARLGIRLRVLPDRGRGRHVRVNGRMHPTGDLLMPLIDKAGIGLTLVQQGAEFVLDVYEPRTYPRTLSEAGGTVVEAKVTRQGPTSTRVVVGGGGEGVRREFIQVVDEARETTWGDVVEVFRDADDAASDYNSAKTDHLQAKKDLDERKRDVTEADLDHRLAIKEESGVADSLTRLTAARAARDKAVAAVESARAAEASERAKYRAELLERGAETLAEGAPTFGLSVTLSETKHFRYGGPSGPRVGDLVPLEVAPGFVHTDVLREVVIDWTTRGGLQIKQLVGEVAGDTTDRMVGALTATARAVRRFLAGR